MEQVFIQNIKINKVRHLEQIDLLVGECERKHIILTGKNGSGKTSVLNAVATFIHSVTVGKNPDQIMEDIKGAAAGVWLDFNTSFVAVRKQFEEGRFVVAYYKADRVFSSVEPKHVEKVQLK